MHQIKFLTLLFILINVLLNPVLGKENSKSAFKPALMLANVYHQGIDLDQYWVSEKYDGVRALWDGKRFLSRGGNTYHAPEWFIRDFPKQKLDGELWIDCQQFELLVSTVRDQQPDDFAWRKVKYMVFDMPELSMPFNSRIPQINKMVKQLNIEWVKAVSQWKVPDHEHLMKQLIEVTTDGAEGLMLHRGSSFYKGKRSGDLLKVKPHQDAEAVVVGHIAGKGKYINKMGALLVETLTTKSVNKIRFKLGTGFSDQERANPPQIGDIVTFQYRGKTKKGVPRFASFLRIRKSRKN